MTNEQTMTLVLKDAAGNYFLLPQAVLEQCRVPAEHVAELEQLIAAGGSAGDDVQGHLYGLAVAVGVGYFVTKAIIGSGESEGGGGLNANDYAQQMAGVGRALQQRAGGRNR